MRLEVPISQVKDRSTVAKEKSDNTFNQILIHKKV